MKDLGMLCPKTQVLKRTKSPRIESPPNSTKNLGFNRDPSIGGRIRSLEGQDQAQRCTRKLSMIPTNKSEPKHLRIEGTSYARKTDENSSKKTRKSNELQTGNRRNHESFHSLGGQILYRQRKSLTLENKEMRSSPDGLFAWKP
jgi:ribosomal protein L27